MMFQVPAFVQQEIFPLSKEQEKALETLYVIRLTCGKYQFPVKLFVFFNIVLVNVIILWQSFLPHRKMKHHKEKLVSMWKGHY